MKFKKATFEKNYHVSFEDKYLMEKLSFEIEIEEGENEDDAADIARAAVHKNHIKNNPQLYEEREVNFKKPFIDPFVTAITPKDMVSIKPKFTNTTDSIIYDIEHCADEKELKTYQTLAKSNEKINEAYHNKLKSLQ